MFESIVAFFGGIATAYLLTWPALIGLLFFGSLFEHNGARGWAVFTALVLAVTAYFFFDVPFMDLVLYAVGYVMVGFVWSFWRYKRFIAEQLEHIIKNYDYRVELRNQYIKELVPTNHLDTITAWVLIWPFSFLESAIGDLIDVVQTLIKKVFRSVYHRIYTSATRDLLSQSSDPTV